MSDIISRRQAIENLYKCHMNGKQGFEEDIAKSYGGDKWIEGLADAIEAVIETEDLSENDGVKFIWSEQVGDLIRKINRLQTYIFFEGGERMVKLDAVIQILEDAKEYIPFILACFVNTCNDTEKPENKRACGFSVLLRKVSKYARKW